MDKFKTLKTQLWLDADLEEVWNFHSDPQNLIKISPNFLKLSLLNLPEKIGKGSSFEIVTQNKFLQPFFKWKVEYLEWGEDENYKFFTDTQTNGPFQYWKHKHEFSKGTSELVVGDKTFHPKNSGTWISDSVEYSLKPQFKKVEWVAEKMVTQLFVFRKRRLEKYFRKG